MRRIFFLAMIAFFTIVPIVSGGEKDTPANRGKLGISMNIGWNSLAGMGPALHGYLLPGLCVDAGAGLSRIGWKLSGRLRYRLTEQKIAPFLGAGFIYGTGTLGREDELRDGSHIVRVQIDPSPFVQLTGGVEYRSAKGLILMVCGGYAILLAEDNVNVSYGAPTPSLNQAIDRNYKSGIVAELTIGYALKGKKE